MKKNEILKSQKSIQ